MTPQADPPIDTAIVAVPETGGGALYGMVDMLSAAGTLWHDLVGSVPSRPLFPRFLITRASDAAVVGCIGIDPNEGEVELGYWIARAHWGYGYATEAGEAVLGIARSLGHQRLQASHFLDNPASGRVLQKLGFTATGRVVERHSCGRGAKAPTAEYTLDLAASAEKWEREAA